MIHIDIFTFLYMEWSNGWEMISTIINIIVLITAILGVYISIETLKTNHKRMKKESTIKYLELRLKTWNNDIHPINIIFDNVKNGTYKKWDDIPKKEKLEVSDFLNQLECFSNAINIGVYDIQTVVTVFGSSFVNIYRNATPIIDLMKKNIDQTTLYEELESQYEKIKKEMEEYQKKILEAEKNSRKVVKESRDKTQRLTT